MKRILTVALMALPTPLLAHGLHDEGTVLAGAMHPLAGADHVLAMVALGLLAAQLAGRSLWALPVSFVGAMLAGGVLGAAGMPFPAVEPMILASTFILGVLVALAVRLPVTALVPLVAVFGLAHGWAHGTEGPASGIGPYVLGFAVSTAFLHLAGIALGRLLPRVALRGLGAAAAIGGLALAVAA
jgi:urease accessory protein